MPADASKAESSRSRLVAAVAATEAERTARVLRRRFSEPPLPLARDLSAGADEGVTDFALRRTRVAAVDQSGADALTDLMTERWPWLESLDEDDGCDDTESLGSLYAGTSRYFRYGEVWS